MSEPAHLLPPSATHAEVAQARAMARLADIAPKCREMWSPTTCPASHLPWLAWAFSVDEWDTTWSDAQKRAVIRAAFGIHQHKGTVAALRTALDTMGYDIELLEWYQESPPAIPYTFGITAELPDRPITPGLWAEIKATALAAKNARSHLRYVRLRRTLSGKVYVGGTTLFRKVLDILPWYPTPVEPSGKVYVGAACTTFRTIDIYPRGPNVLGLIDGAPLQLTDGAPLRLLS